MQPNIDSRLYMQYNCIPHSSVLSYVTISIRSLHASNDGPFEMFCSADDNRSGLLSCLAPSDPTSEDFKYGNRYRVSVRLLGVGEQPIDGARIPLSTAFSSSWRTVQQDSHPSLGCSHLCTWDERALVFPIRWKDLPRTAMFYLEIFSAGVSSQTGKAVATAFLDLWEKNKGTLKMGLQRLVVTVGDNTWDQHDVAPETSDSSWSAYLTLEKLNDMERRSKERRNTVPQPKASNNRTTPKSALTERQITGFSRNIFDPIAENELYQNESDRIPSVPWLDNITRQRCEQILKEERLFLASEEKTRDRFRDEGHDSTRHNNCSRLFIPTKFDGEEKPTALLVVELPQYDIPIVYEEVFYNSTVQGASGSVSAYDLSMHHKLQVLQAKKLGSISQDESLWRSGKLSVPMPDPSFDVSDKLGLNLVQLLDFECEEDNPVEEKYRTLQHELIRGLVDPALKPDKEQRARLNSIVASTSQHLTREEKDLLWRFRFSLVDNRKALTKFLLAVEWGVESEVVQAVELLSQWRMRSPIEVTDALRLLGKNVAFRTSLVRTYAIETLAASPDEDLVLYLLQLVQALKYENVDIPSVPDNNAILKTTLDSFLIDRASKNIQLANYLYWYLRVEMEDPTYGVKYRSIFQAFQDKLSSVPFNSRNERKRNTSESKNPFLTLWGGLEDKSLVENTRSMWDVLTSQDRFISGIMKCQQLSREVKGKKDSKEQHLREILQSEGFDKISGGFPVPLPSAPTVMVRGIKPESVRMFKSALYPALVEFITDYSDKESEDKPRHDDTGSCHNAYKVIVKTGDDLRQDQLVIMMIFLMDGILKRGTLDLCLKPYSIIATSTTSGLVEFVENSFPISHILSSYNNSIMTFFQKMAPCNNGAKYGIDHDVLQRYIRSCAGYCVITYLLGVGDRHLDNIMLQSSGHFFHIDFGFIFGRDPKPLPPAFRLTREMVDGMGGMESPEYRQFCALACQAFNLLRKNASLILNLLYLMSDAGIEDLSNNPYADAEGVIAKVEERFRLELTDEQAESFFLGLVNDCLSALAPRVMDVFHQIAVARR